MKTRLHQDQGINLRANTHIEEFPVILQLTQLNLQHSCSGTHLLLSINIEGFDFIKFGVKSCEEGLFGWREKG
jgi:hypothetical protein